MFDLVDILKRDDKKTVETNTVSKNCAIYYQTEECLQRVQEAFRYEGMAVPVEQVLAEENFDALDDEAELVFVELTQAENVEAEAKRILPLLPAHLSVVIIGSEDTISIIRQMKEMGLYYLFWPVNKQDLIDFYHSVMDNRGSEHSVSKKRRSKRAAIISVKGGLGSTLLSAELASLLSKEKKISTLIVDHEHNGGNLDIMLDIKQFEKRILQPGTLVNGIDNSYASGLVKKVNPQLSLLSVYSDTLDTQSTEEYVQSIVELLTFDVNFILQDYGNRFCAETELEKLFTQIDTLILLLDPTVSSMRNFNRLITLVRKFNVDDNVRLLTVMNSSRPKQTDSISRSDVEKYATAPIDIVIPFDSKTNERLLMGERLYRSGFAISEGINALAAMLMGEEPQPKKGVISLIRGWVSK